MVARKGDDARRELGVSLDTAHAMLRRRDLTADTERDCSGVVFVIRASAESHCSIELLCLAKHRPTLLLVQRDAVPKVIGAQLGRLRPQRIVVLGGEGGVSAETARTLDGYVTQ